MNVDVDNETAEEEDEDETGPGCYILRLPDDKTRERSGFAKNTSESTIFASEYLEFCRTNVAGASLSCYHRTTWHW
jgi:hypothetical protein